MVCEGTVRGETCRGRTKINVSVVLARRRPRRKEDFYIVIFLSRDKGQVRLSSVVPLIKSLSDLLFLMLGISNHRVEIELISIICTQQPLSQINVTETLPTKDLFTSTFSFLTSHHQTRRHRCFVFFLPLPPSHRPMSRMRKNPNESARRVPSSRTLKACVAAAGQQTNSNVSFVCLCLCLTRHHCVPPRPHGSK